MDEAKIEPDAPAAGAELLQPKCAHCGAEPITVTAKELTFPNGLVVLMVWCANPECRSVLSASYRGTIQPRIMPPHPRA